MQSTELAPRRTQFSSCDECRRSRVACDARRGQRNNDSQSTATSCTRCINRQRECTFEWMRSSTGSSTPSRARGRGKAKVSQARNRLRDSGVRPEMRPWEPLDTDAISSDTGFDPSGSSIYEENGGAHETQQVLSQTSVSTPESPLAFADQQWLRTIYNRGFETIFGSWMGKWSNPFLFGEQSISEECVSISQLCIQLDKCMNEGLDSPVSLSISNDAVSPEFETQRIDTQIEQSLDLAIRAFASRWLPLTSPVTGSTTPPAVVIRSLWRSARRDMLKVINRPAYRSMLTLPLFALTPIPVGVTEEEELDGISGQVCVHAALQQIQTLRAQQRSLQFNGTRVSLTVPNRATSASPQALATSNFINAESTAYWAALTFDTSASLTLSCRPLLSSGLFGFESESSWKMVRTCMGIFRELTKDWNSIGFEITEEKATQIIAAGSAWKLLVWKLTANLKESLRDGHDETEVSRAFHLVSDSVDCFNSTYRDLLGACQKRIHFLSQETKLRWYELMMHYHLCILMSVDIIAATDRQDLLSQFSAKRVDAESWVLDCLMFGLNNKYSLSLTGDGDTSVRSRIANLSVINVSLISIDPYPHHVVAAVKLMQQAIGRDFAAGKITTEAYHNILSILTQALEQLPRCSKSVETAISQLAKDELSSQPLY